MYNVLHWRLKLNTIQYYTWGNFTRISNFHFNVFLTHSFAAKTKLQDDVKNINKRKHFSQQHYCD